MILEVCATSVKPTTSSPPVATALDRMSPTTSAPALRTGIGMSTRPACRPPEPSATSGPTMDSTLRPSVVARTAAALTANPIGNPASKTTTHFFSVSPPNALPYPIPASVVADIVSLGNESRAAWSSHHGMVVPITEQIRHDLYIAEMLREHRDTLEETFGPNLARLRERFGPPYVAARLSGSPTNPDNESQNFVK